MKMHLLNVYPHSVDIKLPDDTDDYNSDAYGDRIEEAVRWLEAMKLDRPEHWDIDQVAGDKPTSFGFKRTKDALLFKMSFG